VTRADLLTEARALGTQSFALAATRAEAFEALRERVEDDDELVLFDLAWIEARAHNAARGGEPWAGDEADVLLSALSRVVVGSVVEEREREFYAALDALRDALADRRLDASSEVATSAWLALARGSIRVEDRDRIAAALTVWHRACAGAQGTTAGQCALTALELASHADDAEAARDAAEQLWRFREPAASDGMLDAADRASLIAPVWQVRMALGDAEGARVAANALVALCIESDRPARVADALAAAAECAMAQGDHPSARSALARRLEISEGLLAEAQAAEHTDGTLFALARRDEAREALSALDAMLAEAEGRAPGSG